jgi:carboxyl-terminal processing protease
VGELRNESPAERAGIAPGWMIMNTSLNATPAGARFSASILPLDEAGIRAADTTGFPPAVLSQNQLDEFARTRAVQFEFALRRLSAREVFEERRLGDITYVRFDGFDGAGGAAKALEAIDRAGPAGLIIDLRYNRGGRGLEMSQVLAKLLGSGVVVGHQASRTGDKIPVKSLGLGSPYEGPAVLLIGPATASAAEITAAAVQDHERGKLIGRRTNGSVVSASKFDLPDGGRIMIPVQDFRRLDSRRIEGFGVEPDIWMLPSLDDVRQGRDPLLERALVEMTRKKL